MCAWRQGLVWGCASKARRTPTPARDVLETMKLCFAAEQSAASRAPVALGSPGPE